MTKKSQKNKQDKKKGLFFRVIRRMACFFYGKKQFIGLENLPSEPCIIVSNHAQLHGPLTAELKLPFKNQIWCIGQLMHYKGASKYAYNDFWGYKPKHIQWFYKGLSYIVSPLIVYIHKNADTIAVYKDNRVLATFKNTISRLKEGKKIIIFPECHQPFNNIINEFQQNFVDVAKLYYKQTGKLLKFVPMYIAPKLKTVVFGDPIAYDNNILMEKQRENICSYLKQQITALAQNLPKHTVVPYANIPKHKYPLNK